MKRNLLLGLLLLFSKTVLAGPPSRILFIENKNQWDCNIHFAARIPGGNMILRPGGFRYVLMDQAHLEELHEQTHNPSRYFREDSGSPLVNGVIVDVDFIGANSFASPSPSLRSSEYYNFFIGNDRDKWASEAYGYQHIQYVSFYDGIDLQIYPSGKHVKYDLIVSPGADHRQIRIRYDGADQLSLVNGNLYVRTGLGDIIEKKPVAHQIIDGHLCEVPAAFQLDNNILSFAFPEGFDPCFELVIDPLLIFSTFSGSEADNWGSTATPAEHGNLYSAGVTNHFVANIFSGTYPATSGAFQTTYGGIYDIGILKYDSLGKALLYASYLGGAQSESPHSLVVNKQNELIVLGTTSSSNFPTTAGAFDRTFDGGPRAVHVVDYEFGSDITVSRISADGKSLLASTFLGGTGSDGLNINMLRMNYGDELRGDVITDDIGNIYISTVTSSLDFAGVSDFKGGESDAILMKLPPAMDAITWLNYIGGGGTDAAHTLKIDADGNIYTAGGTSSPDFPVTAGAYQSDHAGGVDGWVAKLDNDGNLIHASFSGSNMADQIYFLDLNKTEEVYVYGQTSGMRDITPGVYSDPGSGQFIQKFSNDLSTQELYTVFGTGKGTPDISPTAFMVSDCNYLYMAGWGGDLNLRVGGWNTSTQGLPVSSDALQKTSSGHDFYFIVLAEDASERLYATFLGGPVTQTHVDGGTSRFDKSGIVYHAVCAGCRGTNGVSSSDFPTTEGVVSRTNNSENCNNAAFKFDLSSLRATLVLRGAEKLCLPAEAVFDNFSIGGEIYIWDFGDGSPELIKTDRASVKHEYTVPGNYTVWLKTIDQGTCKVRDSASVKLQVADAMSTFPDDATICEGSQHTLVATGGINYTWTSMDGKYNISGPQSSLTVSPKDSTEFVITITEASGCVRDHSVWVNVIPQITPDFTFERNGDCSSDMPELLVKNTTDSLWAGDFFEFDFGDGTVSDLDEVIHKYEKAGTYQVKLSVFREFCVTEKVVPMAYGPLKYPNVITPGLAEGKNDRFIIQFGDDPEKSPLDYGLKTQLTIYDRWGRPVYESDDYKHDWNGSEVSSGVYYYHASVQDYSSCRGWLHVVK